MNRLILLTAFLLFPAAVLAQEKPTPTTTTAPSDIPRPRLADSATGYIDNAIVGSQFRFRFDSGFGVNAPDRAEFFYAKCGCYRFLPPTNSAFDPNAPGPGGPGQVEQSLYFQEWRLDMEYAPSRRISVMAEIPARAIEPNVVPRTVGFGDFRFGAKYAAVASENSYVTGQMRIYTPTGDARRGAGTNHYTIEPALLYHQRLSGSVAIAGEFGDWHPIKGSAGVPTSSDEKFAGDVLFYGAGASVDVVNNRRLRVTPVLEFVGWHVLSGFQTFAQGTSAADGTNIANIKIGSRFSSGGGSSFYIGFGRALTDAVWYQDIVRMEYRFAF